MGRQEWLSYIRVFERWTILLAFVLTVPGYIASKQNTIFIGLCVFGVVSFLVTARMIRDMYRGELPGQRESSNTEESSNDEWY